MIKRLKQGDIVEWVKQMPNEVVGEIRSVLFVHKNGDFDLEHPTKGRETYEHCLMDSVKVILTQSEMGDLLKHREEPIE